MRPRTRVPRPATADNGAVTTPVDRTVPRHRWLLAALVIALAALPVVLRYLVFWPLDQWQVDVEVYREAGVSILTGRPVYAALTEAPQLLPFTYPPFAAVLAIPLALMPFGAAGWLWTALQVLATTAIVWYAGYRLIHRTGAWVPLTLALLTAPDALAAPGERRHPVRSGQRVHRARLPDGPARAAPRHPAVGAARRARRARDGGQADPRRVRRALPRHQAVEGGGDRGRHGGRP